MPKGESNKFVYDISSETGKPLTTHQFYDGTQHPWEFKRVWHLEPSLSDPDTVYAGVEDAACSARRTAEKIGMSFLACADTVPARSGSPAPEACACIASFSTRSDSKRMYIAISAAGAFRTDDCGETWKPINQGLYSKYIPNPTAEVGHCGSIDIAMSHTSGSAVDAKALGVIRSNAAGDEWTKSVATCRLISDS